MARKRLQKCLQVIHMSHILDDLIALLDVKKIEDNVFEGDCQDLGYRQVYGGQVLAQCVKAAMHTIQDLGIHSLQCYFLRPGDVKEKIYFEVDNVRNGKSFATRRVVAKQRGRAICILSASFQKKEVGHDHAMEMPNVPGPEGIESEYERLMRNQDKIDPSVRENLIQKRPFEIRIVDPVDYFTPHKRPPLKYLWMRADGSVKGDSELNNVLLAYASDYGFILTSLLPHGLAWVNPSMQCASLDHAMWFHRPTSLEKWHLYVQDSPSAGGARGFVRGSLFDISGNLVASTAQEGLIRDHQFKVD
jgi:acyl-CoA thioesterase-2